MGLLSWNDAHPLATASPAMSVAARKPPTALTPPEEAGFRRLFRSSAPFRVVLALEDDDNGRAVIRLAEALTTRGAVPRVVHAVKPIAPASEGLDSMFALAEAVIGDDFHEEQVRSFRALISLATGRNQQWSIQSVTGDPTRCILTEAAPGKTDLLLMGIHRHGRFEQAMGENTATRVMSHSAVPVLGVRPASSGLPRRIMVATDFGTASREAAHVAANLANPGGTVILVNVSLPSPVVDEGDEGAALVQHEGIEHAFLHLREEISAGKSIRVEILLRTGDAGTELLSAARALSHELVVMARQRHQLITRLLLGSVTSRVLREGEWPMLIIPPVAA